MAITRTLQSRVVALAGIGVFVTGAGLSLLSRQSLLQLDLVVQEERRRVAEAAATAIGRDLVADLETLEAIVAAPRASSIDSWARTLRVADGICRVDAAGAVIDCSPSSVRTRIANPDLTAAVTAAVRSQRPAVSPFVRQADGSFDAIAVVPADTVAESGEIAAAIVAAAGPRMIARLPRHTALAVSSNGEPDAGVTVPGTPWPVRAAAPPDRGNPVATFRRRSLWFAPSLAALAILMAWGIALSVQRPVQALSLAAERIAAGNLYVPIPGGNDEIGRLGTALENMRARLRDSIEATAQANADLERRVEERTAQLQRLLRKVISAQEDERRRIARELHDETSQVLTALGMALHTGPPTSRAADLQRLVDRLHDGVHRLIVNLRPPVLDDLGLAAAIQGYAASQLGRSGISVRCELGELQDARLDSAVEIAVFRIVQEAMLNILRHSGATVVLVQGGLSDSTLWIEVEDDGRGFEPAAMTPEEGSLRGVGLLGMRERADLIGGRLTIDSAPGQGTAVRLEVPVQRKRGSA